MEPYFQLKQFFFALDAWGRAIHNTTLLLTFAVLDTLGLCALIATAIYSLKLGILVWKSSRQKSEITAPQNNLQILLKSKEWIWDIDRYIIEPLQIDNVPASFTSVSEGELITHLARGSVAQHQCFFREFRGLGDNVFGIDSCFARKIETITGGHSIYFCQSLEDGTTAIFRAAENVVQT